jgi:hypothetical protein
MSVPTNPIAEAHASPKQPLIPGVEIEAGGYTWTMPPLNIRQMREYQKALKVLDPADELTIFDTGATAIHQALTRNYPGLKFEDALDIIDVRNFGPLLNAMRGISGLVAQGEAEARPTSTP